MLMSRCFLLISRNSYQMLSGDHRPHCELLYTQMHTKGVYIIVNKSCVCGNKQVSVLVLHLRLVFYF